MVGWLIGWLVDAFVRPSAVWTEIIALEKFVSGDDARMTSLHDKYRNSPLDYNGTTVDQGVWVNVCMGAWICGCIQISICMRVYVYVYACICISIHVCCVCVQPILSPWLLRPGDLGATSQSQPTSSLPMHAPTPSE